MGPGDMCGELGVADGGPRSANAETLEECRLLFVAPVAREIIRDICGRELAAQNTLLRSIEANLGSPRQCRTWCSWICRVARGESSAEPATGRGRPYPASNEPGGARASGRRKPAKRRRHAAASNDAA